MRKRLKQWDTCLLGLAVVLVLLARFHFRSDKPPSDAEDDRPIGAVTAANVSLGMDSEQVRDRLGSLDGSSYQIGNNLILTDFGGLRRLELLKEPKEEDVFSVQRIVTTHIELDGKPILQEGDDRAAACQRLSRNLARVHVLELGPDKGRLIVYFKGDRIQAFELTKVSSRSGVAQGVELRSSMSSPTVAPSARPADPAVVEAVLRGSGYVSPQAASDVFTQEAFRLLLHGKYRELDQMLSEARPADEPTTRFSPRPLRAEALAPARRRHNLRRTRKVCMAT